MKKNIINNYAHDYRNMKMSEKEIERMLNNFLNEFLDEVLIKIEEDNKYYKDDYYHERVFGHNSAIDKIREKAEEEILKDNY